MLSFTRRRLIVLSVFISLAIFAGFKYSAASRASRSDGEAALGGPTISATMTAAPTTDVGTNGPFVNPGDTLEYTVTLNNTGDTGNGVVFTDNLTDANLTLVPGSVKASPIAIDDTYPVTGNVRIQKTAGTLLTNDIRPTTGTNTGLTITAIGTDTTAPFSFNTTNGGTVTATAGDGSFEYNPPAGFEGAGVSGDTFTYTVTDPDGLTGTGTVRLDVSGMIWFVNATAPAGGDGRLTAPFNCLAGAGCFDPVAADDPGDNIFLYSGAYTGGLTLLANQKLIGQGATTTLAGITGITLAADSDALPALGGARPTVTTTVAATNAINLGSGNTLRGFDIGNSTGADISGTSFGTLTATEIDLSGTGRTLSLTTGTLAATFGSITSTSSSGGPGMSLSGVAGNLTVTGAVSVTGASTQGISISGSTLNSTFGSTTVASSTTQGILVGTHTVGTLAFGNTTVTGGTNGVSLQNNASGSRTFGTLNISGGINEAFLHGASGGNVTVTGNASLSSAIDAISVSSPGATNAISFNAATSATRTAAGGNGVNWAGTAGATMSFSSLTIQTNGGTGLNATTAGTITVTNNTGTINNTTQAAPAIVGNAVTLNLNFASINSSGGANGVSLTNVAGTCSLGGGALSGASAATFNVVGGTVSTTYSGNVTQANNAALVSVSGGHGTGTVTFNTGTLSATNGTGLQFDNADGTYNFNGTTTLNGGDAGIDIANGSAGTFTFASGTSINNPSGIAYREDTSNPSVTYNGTITKTNNANNAVDINTKTGSSTSFGGAITATTTTANAIDLTNTGGTVTFHGGMVLNTTSGVGLNATGAGQTVNVCDESPCVPGGTGAVVNTITSTTGTALNVVNTTIGIGNLEFRSISTNGATNGVVLDTTGPTGGLKIKGNGGVCTNATPTCTGGTIQSASANGISVNNSHNLSVNLLRILNVASVEAGVCDDLDVSGCRGALKLTGTSGSPVTSVSVTNSLFSGSGEEGITGFNVRGLRVEDSEVRGFGQSVNENGIHIFNLSDTATGQNLIEDVTIDGLATATPAASAGIHIRNTASTSLSDLSIRRGTIRGVEDGIRLTVRDASNSSFLVTNVSMPGELMGDGVDLAVGNSGDNNPVGNIIVQNNTLQNSGFGFGGVVLAAVERGRGTWTVRDNTISNNGGTAITIAPWSKFNTTTAVVARNNIDCPGGDGTVPGNGNTVNPCRVGIGINVSKEDGGGAGENGVGQVYLDSNTVSRAAVGVGSIIRTGLSAGGRLDIRARNNVFTNNTGNPAIFDEPMQFDAGSSGGPTGTMCLNIATANSPAAGNNNSAPGTAGADSYRIRERAGATFLVQGLANGSSAATTDTFVATNNLTSGASPATVFVASTGGVLYDGGTCTTPTEVGPVSRPGTDSNLREIGALPLPNEMPSENNNWGPTDAVMASVEFDSVPVIGEAISPDVEWVSANAEIVTAAKPETSTFRAIVELVDKMTDDVSPTVYSQEKAKAAPEAGTVTVNGAGSGFTLPTNKSTIITFRATISNPTTPVNTFSVSNQGSVAATGMAPVVTNDPNTPTANDPTVTTVVQPPTITKTFTPANILLDQQSTLTITINNTNPAQAVTGITVTDVFPTNVVVATPLVANTTCGAGTLQDSDGNALAPGDVGIRLVGGTRNAAQSCTVTVAVRGTIGGTYVNTTGNVASFEGFTGTTASSTLNVSVLTASELSISGRVTTAEGRGIRGAVVTITGNSLSQPINVVTGVNGYYSVEGLAAGETYIVTIRSRRFSFANPSRVVTLIDNVTDADFVGLPGTTREQ